MKLAIIVLTCGREDLSKRTFESFVKFNGMCEFAPFEVKKYHADDASETRQNEGLARLHGFEPIASTKTRTGIQGMHELIIGRVTKRCQPTHIMILENDWESARPMPWRLIEYMMHKPDVYHLRLWHDYKHLGRATANDFKPWPHRGHRGRKDPRTVSGFVATNWQDDLDAPEPAEIGDIHYGNPPNICRAKELRWLHENTGSEKAMIQKSGQITARTLRVKKNVFWHIGDERTPGFRR